MLKNSLWDTPQQRREKGSWWTALMNWVYYGESGDETPEELKENENEYTNKKSPDNR